MILSNVEIQSAEGEFIRRYDHWLEMFARAEKPAPSPLVREGDRVVSREGYPNEGWTGYVIEPQGDGYAVLAISTERLMNPLESLCGFFSTFELAGKYVIWNIGGRLRVRCRVKSLRLLWEPQSLAPGVRALPIAKYKTRYELVDDPSTYMIIEAGGIQPENRLLTMSYDDLDRALEEGLPGSVTG